jgi:hypothetical protein
MEHTLGIEQQQQHHHQTDANPQCMTPAVANKLHLRPFL